MASARMVNRTQFEVIPSGGEDVRGFANQIARLLQERIASEFERANTASGPLRANQSEYSVRKVLKGFDPRRGHRTGRLQSALYTVPAFTTTIAGGRARVSFNDAGIGASVPYASFYTAAKVPGQRIMQFRRVWLEEAARQVIGRTEPTRARAAQRNQARNMRTVATARTAAAVAATEVRQTIGERVGAAVRLGGGLL